ncbi:MAG: metallophosphoesterase [Oscillospiraceae bacterium]|nr:metallophosphoesterase [Oscillospiraceae bacterium]
MSLYAIADLHLSLSSGKPMNIFPGWDNHVERLEKNWRATVSPDDTVVVPGDISWAINFEEAKADFDFINRLNGHKVIMKGNHDYWWNSMAKMNRFLEENGFDTITIVHNNYYPYGDYGICGTRGWIKDTEEPADAKVLAREAGRLETSIKAALADGKKPIVFLHYPPIFANDYNREILDVLFRYDIKTCYYGHLHGNAHRYAVCGEVDGINYQLIAGDFVQFCPKFIM